MILANKIIEERKKLGLSQEELAERLSVSRQAVSKWEGAQSVPDLQKIIALSALFSVSTDYLLRDDMEPERRTNSEADVGEAVRWVSMEEANEFLSIMKEQSKVVAFGVMLCILCPVLLIFLCGLAAANVGGISETAACAVGLAVLFIFVAIAVFLFIGHGSKTEKYEYLEKEEFETAYGITGLVKEKKDEFQPRYTMYLSLGVILCVLSPLPLIITALLTEADVLATSMTALLLCMVAVGVYMIVSVAMVKSSYEILLQEGDFNRTEKKKSKAVDMAGGAYWCVITATYLAWSFLTGGWNSTWIVWPVAGVLYAPFILIVKQFCSGSSKG